MAFYSLLDTQPEPTERALIGERFLFSFLALFSVFGCSFELNGFRRDLERLLRLLPLRDDLFVWLTSRSRFVLFALFAFRLLSVMGPKLTAPFA